MKSIQWQDLADFIESRKGAVELKIISAGRCRAVLRRPRKPEEIIILHEIAQRRWQKALKEKKIKYLSRHQWYYDPSE